MTRGTGRRTPIRTLLAAAKADEAVVATGWVKTSRFSKNVSFMHLYDGSTTKTVQVVVDENLARCGIENGYAIIRASVARGIETLQAAGQVFDLVLLDPPYDLDPARALSGVEAIMAPDALLVLEHGRRQPVPAEAGRLRLGRDLKSGDSALAFYTCPP